MASEKVQEGVQRMHVDAEILATVWKQSLMLLALAYVGTVISPDRLDTFE